MVGPPETGAAPDVPRPDELPAGGGPEPAGVAKPAGGPEPGGVAKPGGGPEPAGVGKPGTRGMTPVAEPGAGPALTGVGAAPPTRLPSATTSSGCSIATGASPSARCSIVA